MKARFNIIFSFCLVLLVCSCDTARNIEDPSQNYFLKYFGGDGDQQGVDIAVDSQGDVYMLGNTSSAITLTGGVNGNSNQLYLVKADVHGKLLWERTYGGKQNEEARDLLLTSDNRLVILANSFKGISDRDILLMTLTTDGTVIDSVLVGFKKPLDGTEADEDASSVTQTDDGFIVAGSTNGVESKPNPIVGVVDTRDVLHLKLLDNLTLFNDGVWKNTYGYGGYDAGSSVIKLSSGEYYAFGYSDIDLANNLTNDFNFFAYKLGITGVPSGGQLFSGSAGTDEKMSSMIVSPLQSGDGFFLAGTSVNSSGTYDIYVSKLRKDLNFNGQDIQFNKVLNSNLDKLSTELEKVSVFPSVSSGFLILSNETAAGNNNFYLTKIYNDGVLAWTQPLIFGGEKDDFIGSVTELPDGRILLVGTMSVGDDAQEKMVLIKVNKDGKFLD